MGIWLELGIFMVVLAWGFWQLHDVKQAKAQRLAEEARRAEASRQSSKAQEAKDEPAAVPPA
jgi:hypothetical protein